MKRTLLILGLVPCFSCADLSKKKGEATIDDPLVQMSKSEYYKSFRNG